MEKIIIVNLTTGTIEKKAYNILSDEDYGRGLAHRLLRENVPIKAGRHAPDNAIIFVPGLFAGCASPSSGRMTVIAKGSETRAQVSNITGNMPQKLGSLGVCAVIIKGVYEKRNAVVHISEDGAELMHMPELGGRYADDIISALKARFGREAAIVGTGIAGDMGLSLSTMFCTYPDGLPEYHCPRSSFGDIPGLKGLRALVVTGRQYFGRECSEPEAFRASGKHLAFTILNNKICGGALPSYGSKALIKLIKNNAMLEEIKKPNAKKPPQKSDKKINYVCAPMCVIGCLNRHSSNSGEHYNSPSQSELAAALEECFTINNLTFLKNLQARLNRLALASLEFVTAARSYCAATGTMPGEELLLGLVDEIERNSETGRLIGSWAEGIAAKYPDIPELTQLTDQSAIVNEQEFQVRINERGGQFSEVSDLDMLYYQVLLLENLGICLFSSFALANNNQALNLLVDMFSAKTGKKDICSEDLILYAKKCIDSEKAYAVENGGKNERAEIPTFTKFLYRYFS